jgi:hypothetical protein
MLKDKLYHEIHGSHIVSRIWSWNCLFSTLLTGIGSRIVPGTAGLYNK